MKRLLAILALAAALLAPTLVKADFSFTSTGSATGFAFTCFSTKSCFASVIINSAGTELFTSGNAAFVQFPTPPSIVATQATGTNLHMVCDSGCASTGGTSSQFGAAFPAAGTAIGLATTSPSTGNMIAWAATANFGSSPGAIPVPAVNAAVTNTNPNGQSTMANSSPIVVASDQSNLPDNIKQINGVTISLGQTTMSASLPVTMASNQTTLPTNLATVGGTALALGQTTMSASVPVAFASNQSALAIATSTTGGASTTGNIVANNTTAVIVKASAGTLYGAQLHGIGAGPVWLKIYNAASATCGTGTPIKRLIIPAANTAANGAGDNIYFGPQGIAFGTGITYCVTGALADADTTAPAASNYVVNLDWQ